MTRGSVAELTISETLLEKNDPTLGTWFVENVLDPAMNSGPLGIYNTAAQFTSLPEVHLPVADAKPYSFNWFVQGVSSGAGSALPFMLCAAGSKVAMRSADAALAGTRTGAFFSPLLKSEVAATITGASLYGALQKPHEDQTRLGNAAGAGAGFLVFHYGNALSKQLPVYGKVLAYPLTGFVGGGTMAEVSSLVSKGTLAPGEQALQAAVQGMATNVVMPAAQEWLTRNSKVTAREAAAREAEASVVAEKAADKLQLQQFKPEGKPGINELARLSRSYSEWMKEHKAQYPTPEEFAKLTPEQITQRGFLHPKLSDAELFDLFEASKRRPLPNPEVVAAEVGKAVADMPLATATGDLIMGEWNMEFLSADKAKFFKSTYKHVVPRHHLMFVEEADAAGLAQIAKDNGYNFAISRANSRGQAVGFLVNPRLKVLGTTHYESVAEVQNIPDLRPAFRINLQDTHTGEQMSAVVVHLKSMRGGPAATAAVRYQQAAKLANALEPDFKGVIAGDWNTFLGKTSDLDPLYKAGFKLLSPGDNTSTQVMGGRLDGFLYKGLAGLTEQEVRNFYKNPKISRGLSDHGLLTTTLGKSETRE
jgi:hypothetical protein